MRRTIARPPANVARTARPPVRGSVAVRRGRSTTVVVPGPAATLRLTRTGRVRVPGVSASRTRHPGRQLTATRTPRRRTVARAIRVAVRTPRTAVATPAPGSGAGAGAVSGTGSCTAAGATGASCAVTGAGVGAGAGAGVGAVTPRATSASALSP